MAFLLSRFGLLFRSFGSFVFFSDQIDVTKGNFNINIGIANPSLGKKKERKSDSKKG